MLLNYQTGLKISQAVPTHRQTDYDISNVLLVRLTCNDIDLLIPIIGMEGGKGAGGIP